MTKICDHTSVGMLVRKDDQVLLIERKRSPLGFACPAGHVDGDASFEDAAVRELKEEVGLDAVSLKPLFEGRIENPCRREDGTWHYWRFYEVGWTGTVNRSVDETKQARFVDRATLLKLAERTRHYLNHEITEQEWEANPGLEVLCLELFPKIGLL